MSQRYGLNQYRQFSQYPKVQIAELQKPGSTVVYGNWESAYAVEASKQIETQAKLLARSNRRKKVKIPFYKQGGAQVDVNDLLLLSRNLILYACHVIDPAEVAVCKVDGFGLRAVDSTNLADFVNLVHLDVSENHIPIHELAVFTRVQSIEAAACMLRNIAVYPGTFATLVTLDLSFNQVSAAAILNLGQLSSLKYLDLTGNDLTELPMSMSGFHVAPSPSSAEPTPMPNYPCLETLILDNNNLTGLTSFPALAGLKTLRHISIARNKIDFVPHLVPNAAQRAMDAHVTPFCNLQVLSLVLNNIAAAEDVIEVVNWPQLKELHLWGNPLTQSRSRLPASLHASLVLERGITVVRHKPAHPPRPSPTVAKDQLRQVDTSLPVLPHLPLGMHDHQERYLAYATQRLPAEPLLPALLYDVGDNNTTEEQEEEEDDDVPRVPGVFMTEDPDDPGAIVVPPRARSVPADTAHTLPDIRLPSTRHQSIDGGSVPRTRAMQPYRGPAHVVALLEKHPEYTELFEDDDATVDNTSLFAVPPVKSSESRLLVATKSLRFALEHPISVELGSQQNDRLARLAQPRTSHSRAADGVARKKLAALQEVLDTLRARAKDAQTMLDATLGQDAAEES